MIGASDRSFDLINDAIDAGAAGERPGDRSFDLINDAVDAGGAAAGERPAKRIDYRACRTHGRIAEADGVFRAERTKMGRNRRIGIDRRITEADGAFRAEPHQDGPESTDWD